MSTYTKTGFSKNFGCCSHWKSCDMGKNSCIYETEDPETMRGCISWRRHHEQQAETTELFIAGELKVEETELPEIVKIVVKEQLTLF